MVDKHHALAREEILEALTSYTGVTTANGATPGNNTLIDSNLIGKNDFISGKAILIGSGVDAAYEDKGVESFDNVTGEITVSAGFSAQIKQGTPFRILIVSSGGVVSALLTDIIAQTDLISQIQTSVTQIQSDVTTIVTTTGEQLSSADFWSNPLEEAQINAAGVTVSLPAVTVDGLPSGATILRAIAMFKFRMVENTNATANKLNGGTVAGTSQVIQVRDDTPGAWSDAINFADEQFELEGEIREGGDVCIGSIDISGIVVGNDGYEFQWLLGRADLDFINFNDVQMGIRVWYSVPPPP